MYLKQSQSIYIKLDLAILGPSNVTNGPNIST